MPKLQTVRFHKLAAPEQAAFSIGPFGSRITKENYTSAGIPVVRGVNLSNGRFVDSDFVYISEEKADELTSSILLPGDLVFTHRGTIGQVTMIPRVARHERYILSSSQVKARLDSDRASPEFYYYWFRSPSGQRALLANASTVGVPGIASPLATIRAIDVPFPELGVQLAIADVLGALDDKIAANEQLAVACHELAQSHVVQAVDSAPRVILSELANITMGSSPPGSTYNDEAIGLPFYQGTRDFGYRFPSRRIWCSDPVRTAQAGATLVSVRAPVGRLNLAAEQCCIGRGLAALDSKLGTPSVLFHTISLGPDAWAPFESEGTVFGSINKQQLASIAVPHLDPSSAGRLEAILAPLDAKVEAAFVETALLSNLRDALLPGLMSGEIRVREAETIVSEAT